MKRHFVTSVPNSFARLLFLGSATYGVFGSAHPANAADDFSFDSQTQGSHVTSLATDNYGSVWVGMQDWAVWNRSVNEQGRASWKQFTIEDGLGDNDTYAVACDRRGRVWVGHLNHGVSVFNGSTWKNYTALEGPLGERIFDIAVSPKDGDVWIATSAGLARYSDSLDKWLYYSRANGLTCDQITSIAFDKNGDIYCGTPADGIVLARADTNFSSWKAIRANTVMPARAKGSGLPSNLVNDVLVSRGTATGQGAGYIYVATVNGLAWSTDRGATWEFVRGADWKANVKGISKSKGVVPVDVGVDEDELLLQDWVTCLTEDRQGMVWVGHLRAGLEARDPRFMRTTFVTPDKKLVSEDEDFIRAMLDVPNVGLLYGRFGNPMDPGVFSLGKRMTSASESDTDSTPKVSTIPTYLSAQVPFPSQATALTAGQMKAITERLSKLNTPLKPGEGAFLGEDWATQGDWVGRYGRGHATLAAMEGGSRTSFAHIVSGDDHFFDSVPGYEVNAQNGPHDQMGMVSWVTWPNTDTRRALYDPLLGHRRHAEWTDVSNFLGNYPWEWDGPDVWVTVKVPAGMHRASLYFFNKDGQRGLNRFRDFPIELKVGPVDNAKFKDTPIHRGQQPQMRARKVLAQVESMPTLARTRINDYWGSVYKQFALCGPATFYFKVGRNHGYGVLVSGVFLDPIEKSNLSERKPLALPWMNGFIYDAPLIQQTNTAESDALVAAKELWSELDRAMWKKGGLGSQRTLRLQALQAAVAHGASPSLIANWRWKLQLWNDSEQKEWTEVMEKAFPNKVE